MMVLVRAAVKSVALGWAVAIVHWVLLGGQGWLTGACLALFCAGGWLLLLSVAFAWRGRREELARRQRELEACSSLIATLRVSDRAAHFHEVSAGRWQGYLMGTGYIPSTMIGNHVIAIPAGQRCRICEARDAHLPGTHWHELHDDETRTLDGGRIVRSKVYEAQDGHCRQCDC